MNLIGGTGFQELGPQLKQHFLSQGYNEQHLTKQIQRALNPGKLVCSQSRTRTSLLAFLWWSLTIQSCLCYTWPPSSISVFFTFGTTTEGFSVPTINCFPSPKKLKDFLVQATLTSTPSELPGNYPCGACTCKTCPILKVTDKFSSHTTGQVYKVKFRASCKSSNFVYLITFRRCGLQYVSETGQPLHARVNGHQFDITQWRTYISPVAKHFNSGAHLESDMKVMVVELHVSTSCDPCLQKVKEGRWIRTLEISSPLWMNLPVDSL